MNDEMVFGESARTLLATLSKCRTHEDDVSGMIHFDLRIDPKRGRTGRAGPASEQKPNFCSTTQTRSTRRRQPVRRNNVVLTHSSRSPQLPPRHSTRRSANTPRSPALMPCRSGVPAGTFRATRSASPRWPG